MDAIARLKPGVLHSLKELSKTQPRSPTRRELKLWARQWNLGAEWAIDWFAHTITWQREGPSRQWDRFYHPRWSLRSRSERKPPTIDEVIKRRIGGADFGDWVGEPRTKTLARQCALRAFQRILRESLEEVGATAISSGLFEPRRRRSRGRTRKSLAPKRPTNEVFFWFAGYQTCGWSRSRIADAVEVERNAVGMAIRKLAAELNLRLRAEDIYDKSATIEDIRGALKTARAQDRASELLLRIQTRAPKMPRTAGKLRRFAPAPLLPAPAEEIRPVK